MKNNLRQLATALAVTSLSFGGIHTAVWAAGNDDHDRMNRTSMPDGTMRMDNRWMAEFSVMSMDMDENQDGTSTLTTPEVTSSGFAMASPRMTMDMAMLMLMSPRYGAWQGMAMINYLDKRMKMVNAAGLAQPTMVSGGKGDSELAARYHPSNQLTLHLGLSLPTGSIDEIGLMMGNPNTVLPYPMQLGSGTYDLKPGLILGGPLGRWEWQAQALGTLRIGHNDRGYALGDRLDVDLLASRAFGRGWLIHAGMNYANWGNIDGRDSRINPLMSPYGDPNRQGGKKSEMDLGISFQPLMGVRLGAEYHKALFQDLDGPQMALDATWTLSAKLMF